MRNDFATANNSQIINISSVDMKETLTADSLCESVKIKIENLTPRGVVSIPVRYEERGFETPANAMSVEMLQDVVDFGLATKNEFRTLARIYKILLSN